MGITLHGVYYINVNVAGNPTFTPEYSKFGKNINAKLEFAAYTNFREPKNGAPKEKIALDFTIWGKAAHDCAKYLSPGKSFSMSGRNNPFYGRAFKKSLAVGTPGVMCLSDDGTPVMVKKMSITIREYSLGNDGAKHINNEIGQKIRRPEWNKPGHPDAAHWEQVKAAQKAMVFDPASPIYGNAFVRLPAGDGIGPYIYTNTAPTVAAPVVAQPVVAPVIVAPPIVAPSVPVTTGAFVVPSGV